MKKATVFDGIYGFLIFIMFLIQGFSLLANNDDPTMWSARASIAQAFFACFTLFATIFMYKRQNEIIRRQINLSLYAKRYAIYNECQNFLGQFGCKDIAFVEIEEKCQWKEYQDRVRAVDSQFYANTLEKEFLFDDKLVDYINCIQTMVLELASISANNDIEEIEKRSQEIRDELSRVRDKFKPYLDFKDI